MNNKHSDEVPPTYDNDGNLFVLTTETYEGQYQAELFTNKTQALAKMQRQKKTRSIDPSYTIKDGFMATDGVLRRVQSLDESLSPEGKIIWRVSQKCFLPGTYGKMDWDNYFATREEAKALFAERVIQYHLQGNGNPAVTIKESEDEMLVIINNKPAVYLDFLARPVGELTQVGSVILKAFTDN